MQSVMYYLLELWKHLYSLFDQCCARMETSDLSMEQLHLKVVWRFAGMRPGALCVMICGQDLMHKWPADSWDTQQLVWNILIIIPETAVIQCVLYILISLCA